MNPVIALLTIAILVVAGLLLFLFWRRDSRRPVHPRPIRGFRALAAQVGRAVESGRQIHISVGRGGLHMESNAVSLAALQALDFLARKSSASTAPPRVTVGEGTLLVAAQDGVRAAYRTVGRSAEVPPSSAHFLADAAYPFVYAAGVSAAIEEDGTSSNVLVGRLGPELALMGEPGQRAGVPQIIGSDDPEGLAVAAVLTEDLIIGEELLAAGAYLEGRAPQLAALAAQDVLRWALALTLLAGGLVALLGG